MSTEEPPGTPEEVLLRNAAAQVSTTMRALQDGMEASKTILIERSEADRRHRVLLRLLVILVAMLFVLVSIGGVMLARLSATIKTGTDTLHLIEGALNPAGDLARLSSDAAHANRCIVVNELRAAVNVPPVTALPQSFNGTTEVRSCPIPETGQ